MVKDEKTDNLDGIVDMSHRCVDIETAKREKKRGGYNFTLKVACFPSSRLLERLLACDVGKRTKVE